MASYSLPVDAVAGRLSKDEEVALRESGTLPDWFFDAVEEERKVELGLSPLGTWAGAGVVVRHEREAG